MPELVADRADPIGEALAVMSFGCAPVVADALAGAVARCELGYLSPVLVEGLAAAVSDWCEREYGWRVSRDRVRPVPDLVSGFRAVLAHFVPPGAAVIVPTPGYMPFLSVPPTMGRQVIQVPMIPVPEGWAYDFDGIREAFARGGRLLVLCNPHNPIGKMATEAELAALEDIVDEGKGLVFADEIHAPLRFGGRRHIVYAARNDRAAAHTITATSASKAFNIPAAKCGQLIFTNAEHAQRWQEIARWYEYHTSPLGVVATIAAYTGAREWLSATTAYLEDNVAAAAAALGEAAGGIGLVPPSATYLLWLDLRATCLAADAGEGGLADLLRARAGVIVTDGAECGESGRGFVRFNAALPRARMLEGLARLVAAVAG